MSVGRGGDSNDTGALPAAALSSRPHPSFEHRASVGPAGTPAQVCRPPRAEEGAEQQREDSSSG